MRKLYPTQPWTPRFPDTQKSPSSSYNNERDESLPISSGNILNFFAKFRKLLVDVSIIALFFSILILLIIEFNREEIILEAIEIPVEIEKTGYSGKVVAEKLLDEARKIEIEINEKSKGYVWPVGLSNISELYAQVQSPEIQVPGTNFTFKTLIRFLRHELGLKANYIRGEVTVENNAINLTLRSMLEKKIPAITISTNQGDLSQLIQEQGGEALLKISKPSILLIRTLYEFSSSDRVENGLPDQKLNELINYCKNNPPSTDNILALKISALRFMLLKKYENALSEYNKFNNPDLFDADTYNDWGFVLSKLNREGQAIEKFQKAVKLDPQNALVYNNWGASLISLHRPQEGISKLQEAIKFDPNSPMPYANWGTALLNLKRPDEAIIKYQKAIEIDPNAAEPYSSWGGALVNLNRLGEANEKLKKAIELDPNSAETYVNLGALLTNLGQFDEAIEKLNTAISLNPNFAAAYQNLGAALNNLKRPNEAIEKLQKAFELNPELVETFISWGHALIQLNRPSEAIIKLKQAIQLDPNLATAYFNLGLAFHSSKRQEVIRLARKFEDEENTIFLNPLKELKFLAELQHENDKWKKAELPHWYDPYNNYVGLIKAKLVFANADQLVKKRVDLIAWRIYLGANDHILNGDINQWSIANLDLNQQEEAMAMYQRAISIEPKIAPAYYVWGLLLKELGYPEEAAVAKFSKAIETDPTLTAAYVELGRSLLRLGHPELAKVYSYKAYELDPKLTSASQLWWQSYSSLMANSTKLKQLIEKQDKRNLRDFSQEIKSFQQNTRH